MDPPFQVIPREALPLPFPNSARATFALSVSIAITTVTTLASIAITARTALAQSATVRVHAETRIELRTGDSADGTQIEGTLRDDLGEPLGDRTIELRVRPVDATSEEQRFSVVTDDDGSFQVPMALRAADYELRADFLGDALFESASVERSFDLRRANVRLRLRSSTGHRFDLDEPSHRIEVVATSTKGGEGLDVVLVDELERELGRGRTDAAGRVVFVVESSALGAPSAGRLRAISSADPERAEKQTEMAIVRFRSTALELQAETISSEGERALLSGTLRDSQGPLADRAIGLFAGKQHLATLLTDGEGRFEHPVSLPRGDGDLAVHARFDSDSPGYTSARTKPIVLRLARPAVQPLWWLLLPIGVSALVFAWLKRRTPSPVPWPARERYRSLPGIEISKPETRLADRFDITGKAVDHATDEPLVGATVRMVDATGAALQSITDDVGSFALGPCAAGRHELQVTYGGYERATLTTTVPHRGQLLGLNIRMRSYRTLATGLFQGTLDRLVTLGRRWDLLTNREARDLAMERTDAREPLDVVHDLVERAVYGAAHPGDSELKIIEREAKAIEPRPPPPRSQ